MNADLNAALYDMSLPRETMLINRDSPVPLHHQVRNYLLDCLERGELQPGQQLLRESEYAARFGISLAPVRQAMLDLVKEGYLYRVPGRGTFVREQKVEEKISILSSFSESMRAKGFSADLRVIELRIGKLPPTIKSMLEGGDEQFIFLQRVAMVEEKAIALLSSYLPARLAPGLETLDLNGQSLYRTLEARYGIVLARAESTIEVIRCRGTQSSILGIPPGTPMLQVEGKTYDVTDQFVEFAQVLYRADRFRFTIESFRRDDRVLHLIGASDASDTEEGAQP
ncbi:MAG TPA: GntR family transcriptional regulator [Ktedonobacteraceae bacterium]|nr:GntR family transcriptional regulator [Ktedonobacteraceae bacterium]